MGKTGNLLGGMTASVFLRDYWQKKPLLVRQAIPHFNGLLDARQLIALSCTEDAQARLVTQARGKWQVRQGPFAASDFRQPAKAQWTVLVQCINHVLPQAAALLQRFDFIPHARLDDLMVSYAPKGGGVGPHFDSYDVFLLQGAGHRRWQISARQDRTLIENAPLKILAHFRPEQEWVLAPGDMLYLPPCYAHNGIAEDDCMTYSIGFRAPSRTELAEQFLVYMQDRICLEGWYADPGLKLQKHPSEIGSSMLQQAEQIIRSVRWGKREIADFLGCYLSEPKPHIFFQPAEHPLSRKRFEKALQLRGVELELRSLMLCHGQTLFMNGVAYRAGKDIYRALRSLADVRSIPPRSLLPAEAIDLMYQWYKDGYLKPADIVKK